jgi:predicted O-methyltransferase YrrM
MDTKKIHEITKNIDGFLSDKEGKTLYDLAKKCSGKGVIVEIGSWKGKSTVCLAKGSKAGKKSKIYAIDPHTGSSEHKKWYGKVWTFEEFKKNIKEAKVDDIVVPIVKTSEEAAKTFDKPVELIFIDGAHEYEYVKKDFQLWFPKVIEGGIMAFHDTISWEGPNKVVNKYIHKSKYFKNIGIVNSITFAEKTKENKLSDRIRNRFLLFSKKIYITLYIPVRKFLVKVATKCHLIEPIKKLIKKE